MSKDHPKAFALEARTVSALSAAKAAWWGANGLLARGIAKPGTGPQKVRFSARSAPPARGVLAKAWFEAFMKDAQDVAAGLYPITEALPKDPTAPLRRAIDFLVDAKAVDARRRRGTGLEARDEAGAEAYPPYYRQNFHYQSGGWLTSESARRYEAQVEALFSGAAGPMRRRALSLLAKAWRDLDQRGLRVLDLACGSGSFLIDLKAAFPKAQVVGLDLSAPYLAEAGRRSGASRLQAAAERLPVRDGALDAVTCIYLFHELPPRVRSAVALEIARVLKPGGFLAFADSVQAQDAPEIARLLEAFPAFFHEPYYESYQAVDLPDLFAKAGLRLVDQDQAFLTKAMLFLKDKAPHENSSS
jgi:ubiquinone/menaquinone biosynthesis C-methylase UbiE